MVQHLIVPVDGSDASWKAVDLAVALARRCDATVDIIEVVFDADDAHDASTRLTERAGQHDTTGVVASARVLVAAESVAGAIGAEVERRPDATVVIASHGRGRSAALLGSVTEEILERIFGPVLVVGPRAEIGDLTGPVVVTVDGSETSESVVPLAAAWGIELGAEPWIVEVSEADGGTSSDVQESAYPARLARRLSEQTGRSAQFEVLHGDHVHDEIARFATSLGAALIVTCTHGRTGMSRFVIGSTAAAIVRHAPCPVLLVRAPRLTATGEPAASGTAV